MGNETAWIRVDIVNSDGLDVANGYVADKNGVRYSLHALRDVATICRSGLPVYMGHMPRAAKALSEAVQARHGIIFNDYNIHEQKHAPRLGRPFGRLYGGAYIEEINEKHTVRYAVRASMAVTGSIVDAWSIHGMGMSIHPRRYRTIIFAGVLFIERVYSLYSVDIVTSPAMSTSIDLIKQFKGETYEHLG